MDESKALADLLQLANNEPERGSIVETAPMLFDRMHEASKHLDELWVAIGGKP